MKIICLEGCSGVGKTTQYQALVEHFTNTNVRTLGIVEKHYEPFKTAVHNWYQTKGPKLPFTVEDITKFAKARAQTFEQNFRNLECDLLILDRYYYTSAAYQTSCGLTPQEILEINKKFGSPSPDITFLLDCDPTESFYRSQTRNAITGVGSVFSTNLKAVNRLRENYYALLKQNQEMELIKTNKSTEKVQESIIKKIPY